MYRAMLLTALSCLPAIAFAAPPEYRLTVLPMRAEAAAYGLNESGDVVGFASFGRTNISRPFLYDSATRTVTNLNVFGGNGGFAYDINEAGWITGWVGDGAQKPFVFDGESLTWIDLSASGQRHGIGLGINDHGHVSGWVESPNPTEAFAYDGVTLRTLGTLAGPRSFAVGINNAGTIVGQSTHTNGSANPHAFVYENGLMTDLGALGGQFDYSSAADINEAGLIVGEATDPATGYSNATIFSNGTVQLLGTLAHGEVERNSDALAVNDLGMIVGRSGTADLPNGSGHAFVYVDDMMYDLNDFIRNRGVVVVDEAWDINNVGQIAGRARMPDGTSRAVFLTPVPEPTTWALAAIGLITTTIARRHNRVGERRE